MVLLGFIKFAFGVKGMTYICPLCSLAPFPGGFIYFREVLVLSQGIQVQIICDDDVN